MVFIIQYQCCQQSSSDQLNPTVLPSLLAHAKFDPLYNLYEWFSPGQALELPLQVL